MSLLAEQIGHIATWTRLVELGYAAPADQYSSHTPRRRLRKVYPREPMPNEREGKAERGPGS